MFVYVPGKDKDAGDPDMNVRRGPVARPCARCHPNGRCRVAGSPRTLGRSADCPRWGGGTVRGGLTMTTATTTRWHLRGQWFDACKCAIPCPCSFAQPPTYGDCDGILLWHVDEGNYGDTRVRPPEVMEHWFRSK